MPASIGVLNEYQIMNAGGFPVMKIRIQADGTVIGLRCSALGVELAEVFRIDNTVGFLSAGQANQVLSPAANAAVALTSAVQEVNINQTAGTIVISTANSYPGQIVHLRVAVSSGGAYTLVVTGGTLTLNSAGEAAIIRRSAANDAWIVMALTASTSVGANIATIV